MQNQNDFGRFYDSMEKGTEENLKKRKEKRKDADREEKRKFFSKGV